MDTNIKVMRVVAGAATILAGSIYAADSQNIKPSVAEDTEKILGFKYDSGPGYFRPVRNFAIQSCPVPLAVAFDNSSRAIVVSSKQRTARLYDKEGQQIPEFIDHGGDAGLTFIAPGSLCLVSRDGSITRSNVISNVTMNKTLLWKQTTLDRAPIFCITALKNQLFLGTSGDRVIRAHAATYVPYTYGTCYSGAASGWVNALEVVDNKLISGNYTGEVALIDIETSSRTLLGDHNGSPVTALAKFGNIVYSGVGFTDNAAEEIKVWDIRTEKPVGCFTDGMGVNAMISLPKGYLAVGRKTGMITLYDMRTLHQAAETLCARHGDNYGSVTALTTTDDGGIISTNSNGLIQIWKEKQ